MPERSPTAQILPRSEPPPQNSPRLWPGGENRQGRLHTGVPRREKRPHPNNHHRQEGFRRHDGEAVLLLVACSVFRQVSHFTSSRDRAAAATPHQPVAAVHSPYDVGGHFSTMEGALKPRLSCVWKSPAGRHFCSPSGVLATPTCLAASGENSPHQNKAIGRKKAQLLKDFYLSVTLSRARDQLPSTVRQKLSLKRGPPRTLPRICVHGQRPPLTLLPLAAPCPPYPFLFVALCVCMKPCF